MPITGRTAQPNRDDHRSPAAWPVFSNTLPFPSPPEAQSQAPDAASPAFWNTLPFPSPPDSYCHAFLPVDRALSIASPAALPTRFAMSSPNCRTTPPRSSDFFASSFFTPFQSG